MKTARFTYKDIDKAAAMLQEGGLVAFPTETVYGLAAIFDSKPAFDALVATKKRRPDKPFTLMCATVSDIGRYAQISDLTKRIIDAILPGPLTLILPAKACLPEWVDLKTGKVGIRVSSLQTIQQLIFKVGKPLLVPSANKADEPPALTGEEVFQTFDGEIGGVIFGSVVGGKPSTIIEIDGDDHVKLIRQGTLTLEEIMKKGQKQP
ncbi:MAG: L-threonylcarbamoyladenylate synthase [Bacilli bacterium]|jgi:L-threonylcarbamoyladenylate synthase